MNNFFYSSFNIKDRSIENSSSLYEFDARKLCDINVDLGKVTSVIKLLPNKYSEDLDGFSYVILKEGGCVLACQLNRLFQMSISTGVIPRDRKKSVIFPIKKKAVLG